jgi:uronate dehydrogenase
MKFYNRILMTGSAGMLGKALREPLANDCEWLRLSDIGVMEKAQKHEEVAQCDLADMTAVHALCEGVNAIVHFGGVSTEQPFDAILHSNIIGLYNLYEAAREHGVRRILFASSNHVMGFYRQSETIDANSPPRPDGLYGVSKAFGEDLSRMYFDKYGIETLCMRIGSSFPEPDKRRSLASWLSHADLYRMVKAGLEATVVGHSIIYGVSDNQAKWYDNRLANHIGYRAKDTSDIFREKVFAKTNQPDLTDAAVQFQGGDFVNL